MGIKETLSDAKKANDERKVALKELKELNIIQREIGKPNLEAERLAVESEREIEKIDKALKKRNVV